MILLAGAPRGRLNSQRPEALADYDQPRDPLLVGPPSGAKVLAPRELAELIAG